MTCSDSKDIRRCDRRRVCCTAVFLLCFYRVFIVLLIVLLSLFYGALVVLLFCSFAFFLLSYAFVLL